MKSEHLLLACNTRRCDCLISSLRKFYGRYGYLFIQYDVPLSRVVDDIKSYPLKHPTTEYSWRYSMKIVFILFLCSFGVIRADFRQDVRNALSRLNGRSNYEFALEVYNLLAGNYPTKDWHVIAYNPILGSDKHQISYCQGIHYFRRSGRNVVVANVPSSKPYINLNSVRQILRSLKTTRRYRVGGFLHLVDRTRNRGAEEIYDNFPSTLPGGCNTGITSRGVIKENADVQHKAKSERLISVVNGAYNLYVFG